MKKIINLFIFLLLINCSFDNKTGIWQDDSVNQEVYRTKKNFKEIKEIDVDTLTNIKLSAIKNNLSWEDRYLNKNNNIQNIFYRNSSNLLYKSKRVKANFYDKDILYLDNLIISYNRKGEIFFYSLSENKVIFKYNFYKNKYKNFKKKLYLAIDQGKLIVADNIGYIYSIQINEKNLIWAKNYRISFRSNIKIQDGIIFLADQENKLYAINSLNGLKLWDFLGNQSFLKGKFLNNINIDDINKNIFFLNTQGKVYSINYANQNINWLLNLDNIYFTDNPNIFSGQELVSDRSNLIVSTDKLIANFDKLNGAKKWDIDLVSRVKPSISSNYLFVVSDRNFLNCIDINNGKILWSIKIFKNSKINLDKTGNIKHLIIAESQIMLLTNKGYVIKYKAGNGELIEAVDLNLSFIGSYPIIVDGYLYLTSNSKIFMYD